MSKRYIVDAERIERTHACICVEADSPEEVKARLAEAADRASRIFDGADGYATDFEVADVWEASPKEVEECRFETIGEADV